MLARRLWIFAGILFLLAGSASAAEPTPAPASYFPLTPGATWKYRVTVKLDDKTQQPFIQTITAGDPVDLGGQKVIPLDDAAYVIKPDGAYLVAAREAAKWVPVEEPQKIVPAKPRTSEAWNYSARQDSTYSTCLGSQTIKTDAGQFETQCVFSSTASGAEGENRRQTYRYFAPGVGLVRETISERLRRPDGTPGTREVSRDLLAFNGGGAAPNNAIEVKPTTTASRSGEAFARARKLAASGDHAAAIEAYAAALKADPDNATILAYKAASHLALQQFATAQLEIGEALKRDEKSSIATEVAGQIKIAQKQITAGRALYDNAAQLAPKEAGAIYTDLAAALAALNDPRFAGAIDTALKSAATADPPSPEALFQLGQSYASAGRPEAKSYLERYIALASKLPESERDPRKLQLARQLLRAMKLVSP